MGPEFARTPVQLHLLEKRERIPQHPGALPRAGSDGDAVGGMKQTANEKLFACVAASDRRRPSAAGCCPQRPGGRRLSLRRRRPPATGAQASPPGGARTAPAVCAASEKTLFPFRLPDHPERLSCRPPQSADADPRGPGGAPRAARSRNKSFFGREKMAPPAAFRTPSQRRTAPPAAKRVRPSRLMPPVLRARASFTWMNGAGRIRSAAARHYKS